MVTVKHQCFMIYVYIIFSVGDAALRRRWHFWALHGAEHRRALRDRRTNRRCVPSYRETCCVKLACYVSRDVERFNYT